MNHPAPAQPVVLVEDDDDVRELVSRNLRAARIDVVAVKRIDAATKAVEFHLPSVVVTERALPDGDGLELCSRIRAEPRFADVAVLVLSGRGAEHDRIEGLAAGADDYVVKPFSVREVVARVRLLMALSTDRRLARTSARSGERLYWRELVIDVEAQRVTIGGAPLELRPLELKLLIAIFRGGGHALTRNDLLRSIWGEEEPLRPRLIDIHIWRLRERLGAYGSMIATVHGSGYRLADE